jgi:hypothetical protein
VRLGREEGRRTVSKPQLGAETTDCASAVIIKRFKPRSVQEHDDRWSARRSCVQAVLNGSLCSEFMWSGRGGLVAVGHVSTGVKFRTLG